MDNWIKKPVTLQQIDPLCVNYGIDKILASILVRRNITEGKDVLYFLEDDLRFQNSPFLFEAMEDAVERILQAKDEGEKVLIFGDKDADGVTSTVILYEQLKRMGIDVSYRLPLNEDAYGLSIQAVDEFAAKDGTLIITVDCGISNFEEISHAVDLGIDVIVTDHHNPPEGLPEATIIIDPKIEDSGYPFTDISGAAVAYKLVSALRFAATDFYNSEVCFMDLQTDSSDNTIHINCLKIRNLLVEKELHEVIIPGKTSIYDLKLPYFLQGKIIYVWDSYTTNSLLKEIFGSSIEFNLTDFKTAAVKLYPGLAKKTAADLKDLSVIGKYFPEEKTIIRSLYNLYVTYCKKLINLKYPKFDDFEKEDLQLVALAALADIMPMKNENRIFVRSGIKLMKQKPRKGLSEIFAKLNIVPEQINSVFLSWNVTPVINAPGRLGQADIAVDLLLSEDEKQRFKLAHRIFDLNEERKQLVNEAFFYIQQQAEESVQKYNNKLCVVIDKRINKGVTGILANRLMQYYNVPAIALTVIDDVYVGSMRSLGNFISTDFLDSFGDIYINHGGHDFAAGFTFSEDKLQYFLNRIPELLRNISAKETRQETAISIDAEIPADYLTPEILNKIDIFEPYGAENPELTFMSSNLKIEEAHKVGKTQKQHLKMTFNCGKFKFPAMYFGQGDRLGMDIFTGDSKNIVYNLTRNYYNGLSTGQIIIKDLK